MYIQSENELTNINPKCHSVPNHLNDKINPMSESSIKMSLVYTHVHYSGINNLKHKSYKNMVFTSEYTYTLVHCTDCMDEQRHKYVALSSISKNINFFLNRWKLQLILTWSLSENPLSKVYLTLHLEPCAQIATIFKPHVIFHFSPFIFRSTSASSETHVNQCRSSAI